MLFTDDVQTVQDSSRLETLVEDAIAQTRILREKFEETNVQNFPKMIALFKTEFDGERLSFWTLQDSKRRGSDEGMVEVFFRLAFRLYWP